MSRPPAPLFDREPDGRPDFDTIYTRCPTCGIVGIPAAANYQFTNGELDPTDEITLACFQAGHRYGVTTSAFLVRDAVRTCTRTGCGTTFPCPAEADEVVCPTCRFCQPGPFLDADDARRDYVRRVHTDFMEDVRARLRQLGDPP